MIRNINVPVHEPGIVGLLPRYALPASDNGVIESGRASDRERSINLLKISLRYFNPEMEM